MTITHKISLVRSHTLAHSMWYSIHIIDWLKKKFSFSFFGYKVLIVAARLFGMQFPSHLYKFLLGYLRSVCACGTPDARVLCSVPVARLSHFVWLHLLACCVRAFELPELFFIYFVVPVYMLYFSCFFCLSLSLVCRNCCCCCCCYFFLAARFRYVNMYVKE